MFTRRALWRAWPLRTIQKNMQDYKKAKAYQRQKQILALINLGLTPLILTLMVFSPYPAYLENSARTICPVWAGTFSLFFVFFSLTFLVIDLPFSFYSGYVLEKKYDLSTQTPASWFKDFIKRAFLGFGVSLGLLLALYVLILRDPQAWWLWAWAGFALFSYGAGKLFVV